MVRRLAVRFSIIVLPDDRRVHERPTPTVGGAAMYLGLLVAMVVASQLRDLSPLFRGSSDPIGLVVAASVIFTVGMVDDLREMSPPAKMSGQILAGTILYLFGINMLFFRMPFGGTTVVLSADLIPVITVLWVVGMANAVNLVDGLDGLAAGIVGIASLAFFVYSHQLVRTGNIGAESSGPLIAVIIIGLCVGFLPHNFHPCSSRSSSWGSRCSTRLSPSSVGRESAPTWRKPTRTISTIGSWAWATGRPGRC